MNHTGRTSAADFAVTSRPASIAAPRAGTALCLSGGGYRAMLFHAGAFLRLSEVGRLASLQRVSSVSGGSIAAGVLALAWPKLQQEAFTTSAVRQQVVEVLIEQAGRRIDLPAVVASALPGVTAGSYVAWSYRKLFGRATLQDLPDDPPRFVFNATNLQTLALFRFSKPYMQDYKAGVRDSPRLRLRRVIAASSAFPPFLSPVRLNLRGSPLGPADGAFLNRKPYATNPILSDGGVYDNLGLETAWKAYKTVLVSDGGGVTSPAARVRTFWPAQLYRVAMTTDTQVRSLRKRAVVAAFRAGERDGAYWGIRTDISRYALQDALPCPAAQTAALAGVKTGLRPLALAIRRQLVNWGYAACDAAIRAHLDEAMLAPDGFPYPNELVG